MIDTPPLELRILSGLHRGASLPLDGQPHTIGAGEDADVVLVDPGIAARHALLQAFEEGWSLQGLDGEVRGARHDQPEAQESLAPGDCARVGRVWITVADAASAWQEPPPEPAPGSMPAPSEDAGPERVHEDPGELMTNGELLGLDEPQALDAPTSAPPAAPQRAGRPRRIVALPLLLGAGLTVAAAYAYSSRPAEPPRTMAAAMAKPDASPPLTTPAALRAAFRQRLREVDLLRRIDLVLDDGAWSMQAALDEDEAARLRRVVAAFVAQHRVGFPVEVRIGGADGMLPFRVTQVVSGANASVVTDDGRRLYPGDRHRGVTLVAVDGNRLRFDGARSIEVLW